MQVMCRWRQRVTRRVSPALSCILCGGPKDDTARLCERDEVVVRLLFRKVEEFTADVPLTDRAMEFISWKEHGCKWTDSVMAAVVPSDLGRVFAMVRAALSRGQAKVKLLPEDMIVLGDDGYAQRNQRLTRIKWLPPGDPRKATYSFVLGGMPFCPLAGMVRQLTPWNPFFPLPHDLQAAF